MFFNKLKPPFFSEIQVEYLIFFVSSNNAWAREFISFLNKMIAKRLPVFLVKSYAH